jgi:hypothetical protein
MIWFRLLSGPRGGQGRWILKFPIFISFSRIELARVTVAHGDYQLGQLHSFIGKYSGLRVTCVHSLFEHLDNRGWVIRASWK